MCVCVWGGGGAVGIRANRASGGEGWAVGIRANRASGGGGGTFTQVESKWWEGERGGTGK